MHATELKEMGSPWPTYSSQLVVSLQKMQMVLPDGSHFGTLQS